MIAIDTSSLTAYWAGHDGPDVEAVEAAFADHHAVLPPVVLSEVLSDPGLGSGPAAVVKALPVLELSTGYWERAGSLRARILSGGRRARLADTLIAQSCIDHQIALITRDRDFRSFTAAGLRLALSS